jgi:hypothetical protein
MVGMAMKSARGIPIIGRNVAELGINPAEVGRAGRVLAGAGPSGKGNRPQTLPESCHSAGFLPAFCQVFQTSKPLEGPPHKGFSLSLPGLPDFLDKVKLIWERG